jgi:hypothetical protein
VIARRYEDAAKEVVAAVDFGRMGHARELISLSDQRPFEVPVLEIFPNH